MLSIVGVNTEITININLTIDSRYRLNHFIESTLLRIKSHFLTSCTVQTFLSRSWLVRFKFYGKKFERRWIVWNEVSYCRDQWSTYSGSQSQKCKAATNIFLLGVRRNSLTVSGSILGLTGVKIQESNFPCSLSLSFHYSTVCLWLNSFIISLLLRAFRCAKCSLEHYDC